MSTDGYHRYKIENKNIITLEGKPNQNIKFELLKPVLNKILNTTDQNNKITVGDLGSSNGLYSFYCALNGAKFVNSVEYGDPLKGGSNSIDIINNVISEKKIQNIKLYNMNIIKYTEKTDLVIALAIIHHLIDDFKDINKLIKFMKNLTKKYLIIEWIGHGEFIKKENVSLDIFLNTLNNNFDTVEEIGQTRYDKFRCVYLCSIKNN